MLHLVQCRPGLFPFGRRNADVLFGQIEIVCVAIPKTRLVAGLSREPLEEPFYVRESRIQRCFAQFLPGLLVLLIGKVPFEGDRLFKMKRPEVTVLGIGFEPSQGFGDRVHRRFAVTLRLLQISEVPALGPFVVGVVH